MKTTLDNVQTACERNRVDAPTTKKIISDLQQTAKLEAEERKAEQGEQKKQKFVLVVSDPAGEAASLELAGYAVTIDDDAAEFSVPEKIRAAVADYSRSKRGRRIPVKTLGEAFENIPAKYFKKQGIIIKHREAAFALTVQNIYSDID